MNLTNQAGKKVYFRCATKLQSDTFLEDCIKSGITKFGSGNAISFDEFYNHGHYGEGVNYKIAKDRTVRIVNVPDGTSWEIIDYTGRAVAERPYAQSVKATVAQRVEKEEKKDMKFDNIFKGMGFEIDKTAEFGLNIMTGSIAFIGKDKAITVDGKYQLTEIPSDFVKSIPLMFIPTPIATLVAGDIVKHTNKVGVITNITDSKVQIQNYNGTIGSFTVATNGIMNTQLVQRLFNPFATLGGENGAMNPMMAMMFMDNDGDDSTMETFMLMQCMQGGFGATDGANPMASMLPLMLMGKGKSGGSDSLTTMLMMQAMTGQGAVGGAGAMNPMMMAMMMGDGGLDMKSLMLMQMMGGGTGGLFGAPVVPAKVAKTTKGKVVADTDTEA